MSSAPVSIDTAGLSRPRTGNDLAGAKRSTTSMPAETRSHDLVSDSKSASAPRDHEPDPPIRANPRRRLVGGSGLSEVQCLLRQTLSDID